MRTRRPEDDLRTLDLEPGATADDIKKAWRDMTKVWHPDRFGGDPDLRKKAEEKLKAINEAYDRLKNVRDTGRRQARSERSSTGNPREWRVRGSGQEAVAPNFPTLLIWVARGQVDPGDEVFHPDLQQWIPLSQIPELAPVFARRGKAGRTGAIIMASIAGMTVLMRKPTMGGLLSAIVVFLVIFFLMTLGKGK